MKIKLLTIAALSFLLVEAHRGYSQTRKSLVSKEKVVYSTNLDFDSTMIDGQKKAPSGFFLQGRHKQSLSSLVKLRSHFKRELRRSRSAVKALVR